MDEFWGVFLAGSDGAGPDEFFIGSDGIFNAAASGDDGGMIAFAEALSDFGEGQLGGFADEVHGDGTSEGDGALSAAGHEVTEVNAEVAANGGEDIVGFDRSDELTFEVAEGLLDHGEIGLLSAEFGASGDTGDGAFEFADILRDTLGDPVGDLVGGGESRAEHKCAEYLGAGGGVWGVDADDHSGYEPIDEGFAEFFDQFGVGVGGDDDLFAEGFDGVEGVEEFFLCSAFGGEEVDVVDDQKVEVADLSAEGIEFVVA